MIWLVSKCPGREEKIPLRKTDKEELVALTNPERGLDELLGELCLDSGPEGGILLIKTFKKGHKKESSCCIGRKQSPKQKKNCTDLRPGSLKMCFPNQI